MSERTRDTTHQNRSKTSLIWRRLIWLAVVVLSLGFTTAAWALPGVGQLELTRPGAGNHEDASAQWLDVIQGTAMVDARAPALAAADESVESPARNMDIAVNLPRLSVPEFSPHAALLQMVLIVVTGGIAMRRIGY